MGRKYSKIQIQHLLKLNIFNTRVIKTIINIQIQHLLKLNNIPLAPQKCNAKFKYNTC